MSEYNPFEIGRKLYRDGLGVSDIWGAVRHDSDLNECHRGYEYEMMLEILSGKVKTVFGDEK